MAFPARGAKKQWEHARVFPICWCAKSLSCSHTSLKQPEGLGTQQPASHGLLFLCFGAKSWAPGKVQANVC